MRKLKIWLLVFVFAISIPGQALASFDAGVDMPINTQKPQSDDGYVFVGRELIFANQNEIVVIGQIRMWPKQATKLSDTTPEFSAIYNDPDSGDYAEYYQIQIKKYDGEWSSPVWDSGKTSLTSPVLEGDRTEDIVYDGPELSLDGMKYFWRIKLWDDEDNEGEWTNGQDYFVMAGKRIQDLSYTYDNVGNIMRIDDQSETNTRKTAEYEYDDLYRLTSATITNSATQQDYTQTYTYDSLGNFTNRSDAGDYEYTGNTGTSYANPHAVTDVGGLTINYDYNGNLTDAQIGNWNILTPTWDYNNRMVGSSGIFQSSASYSYDQNGERIIKNVNSGESVDIYANKYYDKKTAGEDVTQTENVYANGQLALTAVREGSGLNLYYVHGDQLGSSNVMTTSTGGTEQTIDYFPYGNIRFNEQNSTYDQSRKFTQKEIDYDASGLTYFGARYYSGEVGRFVSEDPVFIGMGGPNLVDKWISNLFNPQLANSYSYASNNPLKYIDPLGMYNKETGQVEKGDTPDSIVSTINSTFNIKTDWATVLNVSFYSSRFGNQTLDQIVGQSLWVGTNITADITGKLDGMNVTRSLIAKSVGRESLLLFTPQYGPWDIKYSSDPILGGGEHNRTYRSYIYNGELIRYDAPGNINYGYVARSLGLSGLDIHGGAAIEQFADNLRKTNGFSFADNGGDSAYVQKGINAYNSRPWWQKLLRW